MGNAQAEKPQLCHCPDVGRQRLRFVTTKAILRNAILTNAETPLAHEGARDTIASPRCTRIFCTTVWAKAE